MSAVDHGPTCADSPQDHYCGNGHPEGDRFTDEPDQGATWRDWTGELSSRMHRIVHLHVNTQVEGGGVTGFCCECDHIWPCATYHVAAGWGLDSFYDCEDAGWCDHMKVKM